MYSGGAYADNENDLKQVTAFVFTKYFLARGKQCLFQFLLNFNLTLRKSDVIISPTFIKSILFKKVVQPKLKLA